MSFLTNPDLRTALAEAVRSDGRNGLTTARDLRDFLGLLLDELEAEAARAGGGSDNLGNHTATQPLDLAGFPLVSGNGPVRLRAAPGTPSSVGVLCISGADGYGQSIALQPATASYVGTLGISYKADGNFGEAFVTGVRLADNRPTHFVINNYAGTTLLALRPDGRLGLGTDAPTERLDVDGTVRATAFVGDGAQLTNLPTGPRCTATGLAQTQFTGSAQVPVSLPFTSATGTGYDVGSHRFAPGKAGFYGITTGVLLSTTGAGEMYLGLIINGTRYVTIQHWQLAATGTKGGGTGYVEVELGATDSAEVVLLNDNGDQPYQVFGEYYQTFFSARWLGF